MKSTFKVLGTQGRWLYAIAMLALLALSFAACDDLLGLIGDQPTPPSGTAPAITTASLPNGTVGTAYSQTLAATGETPITWSVESGTLPAGLSLEGTTGVISGTPTTAATSTFTVKATNSKGSNTKQLSITTTDSGTVPTFTTIADFETWLAAQPDNTAATAYEVKLNVSNLGDAYTAESASDVLYNNSTKYVSLDLSGSTFTNIPDHAFVYCTSLTGVTMPDSVTSIGDSAFSGCSSLARVTIPKSVASIRDYAFGNCSSLASITVAEDNANYSSQDGVLYDKGKTTLIQYPAGKTGSPFSIPDSVTGIGVAAFYCCTLTSITMPDGLTTIGVNAFSNCSSLTSVTIPESVTSIGYYAFDNCSSLASITVAEGNANYSSQDGVLYDKEKTTLIQYPAGKTDSTFAIPDSVATIEAKAFYNCSALASITIPSGVTSIANQAFFACNSLTSVEFKGTIEIAKFDINAFGDLGDLRDKYRDGGIGTYTREANGSTWTKQ